VIPARPTSLSGDADALGKRLSGRFAVSGAQSLDRRINEFQFD
jgi:hypothetical protein